MTNEDVDVWESLAKRLCDKLGKEEAAKLIVPLMLNQAERAIHPDGSDAFIMNTIMSPDTHPMLRRYLKSHVEVSENLVVAGGNEE